MKAGRISGLVPGRSASWLLPAVVATLVSPLWGDVIIFKNGDRLTGTIKRLERGQLTFDSPAIDGDIQIDWKRVKEIDSARTFQFHTTDGRRFLGRIEQDDSSDSEEGLLIQTSGRQLRLKESEVFMATQTQEKLKGLLEVDVGAGFSLTKANDQKQFSADMSVTYETPDWWLGSFVNSLFTTQKEVTNTNRHNVQFGVIRSLSHKWGVLGMTDFLTSEQQQLDLRSIVGGGPSRILLNSDDVLMRFSGGAVWNNERFDPLSEVDTNNEIEGLASLSLSFFRFRQWNVETDVRVYPSFTTSGRIRLDSRTALKLRLLRGKKLWWSFNLMLNLDNKPPSTASGNDYVTTTSVNWSFP